MVAVTIQPYEGEVAHEMQMGIEEVRRHIETGFIIHAGKKYKIINEVHSEDHLNYRLICEEAKAEEDLVPLPPVTDTILSVKPKVIADVDSLLQSRGAEYGDAWILGGKFLADMMEEYNIDIKEMIASGFFYAWQSILSKLLRALQSPRKKDHWDDIAGYATLVSEWLEANDEQSS